MTGRTESYNRTSTCRADKRAASTFTYVGSLSPIHNAHAIQLTRCALIIPRSIAVLAVLVTWDAETIV